MGAQSYEGSGRVEWLEMDIHHGGYSEKAVGDIHGLGPNGTVAD